ILIVEDHPSIRSMLVSLFSHAGFEVVQASDGAQGLAQALTGGFSAILLDLKMPQLDGFEFLEKIKATPPPTPNGPIIVFSSHSYDYARKQALDAGAADFIIKDDLSTTNLVQHIESIIAAHPHPQ